MCAAMVALPKEVLETYSSHELSCGFPRSRSATIMGLSIRSPRYIHRVLAVAAVLFVFATIFSGSTLNGGRTVLTRKSWSKKPWMTRFIPRPCKECKSGSNGELAERPLGFHSNQERMNATFVSLVRNSELDGILSSIREVETRFNRNYQYDWTFLNDEEFTKEFKVATSAATSGRARYGKVGEEHWGYPQGIDRAFAENARNEMAADKAEVPYGSSESYRHMCRYQSGFFYRHPLVAEYDWYWRVEPNIELFCDIPYDPFKYMADHGKKYSFVISLNEISKTVPSLWTHVRAFMEDFRQHISKNNHLAFLSEDGGETTSYCHFWSNFEIASLDFFRSGAYNDFFSYLDESGGFFYERWGDASVHSIAAALMLDKGEIHFFDDIGYGHHPLMSCPRSEGKQKELNCRCKAEDNMDWSPSCTKRFFETSGIEFPEGYDRNVPPEPGLLR